MANIEKELATIANAIYGEQLRGAIHDAIEKINAEVEQEKATLNEIVQKMNNS